ncbi:MAG: alpha-mannosidase [Promethearchaeota archaeon]|jgi:mannosylglycerate hydrolase
MKANNIILVPETHWDREWYLPFQEFRARLVIMMDKLLDILKTDQNYKNFTLDGQIIPLEDYLEVRPDQEEDIKKFIKEGRLSIGPMYVLPDEFLVSGESLIRNLLLGHQIGRKLGRVMKAGYIPDPFGHIAQLPQILQGFEIPSVLFWRGFGNQFEENNLNVEFIWNAPGKAASLVAVFLIKSYGSLAELNTKTLSGEFKPAFRKIKNVISDFENYTATPYVLLNSGSDHHEARPEIPEIIKQWNHLHPDKNIEQADFEHYVKKIIEHNPQLKEFQGELRGGRYAHLLSGVFSARMWIKQRNTAIEYLYEKYTEPISTITWTLDKSNKFSYPRDYILTGLKWLQKNAPHDSICGCSIDEVHNEMVIRFDWAEQIANEVYKNSFLFLSELINFNRNKNSKNSLIVYNPLPWRRIDRVEFNTISRKTKGEKIPHNIKIVDHKGKFIETQHVITEEEPRFSRKYGISHKFTFLAEVPACGYTTYHIIPTDENENKVIDNDFKITREFLENEYYRVDINSKGIISVLDKDTGIKYESVCEFEDVGDWGDEYDYSGPYENQTDLYFSSEDAAVFERSVYIDGSSHKCFKLRLNLKLPHSLTEDRYNREDWLVDNKISMLISLYKGIRRIDFEIQLENNSCDHRIRVLFPTKINCDIVNADGHFYVNPRNVKMPNSEKWVQKPLPTNHQKDFVSISNDSNTFAILNKGLPEYEAIINPDNTITFAITLLRCVEWLSRDDFITRKSHAGPGFQTPGAQCLGKHKFELSLITESKSTWLDSEVHSRGKEFNNPLRPLFPNMIISAIRSSDKIILRPSGIISYLNYEKSKDISPYLPPSLSFLAIDNRSIVLSALKKAEVGDFLIIRIYNISSIPQNVTLTFNEKIIITNVELVSFLEEPPQHEIKARINNFTKNTIDLGLESHVITTLKIKCES